MPTTVFSLELASAALTRWEGLAPKCLCRHRGGVMASDGSELHRLVGPTDNGAAIPIRFSLPATDCGEPAPKRLRAVRLTGVLGGSVAVSAHSDTGSSLEGQAPAAGQDGLPGLSQARLGRGHGRTWRLDLAAEDGAPLDIGAIEPVSTPLDRRDS
jgi:hypothetical protein